MENHSAFNSSAVDIKSTGSCMCGLISSEVTEGGKLNSTTQSYSFILLPLQGGAPAPAGWTFLLCCVSFFPITLSGSPQDLTFRPSDCDAMHLLFVSRTLFKMTWHATACVSAFSFRGFLFLVF